MSFICTRMPFVYYRMSSVCHSYAISMSLVCTRMSLVCTRMLSYATHMYLFVTRMSLVCTRMSPVCHSYVLVCHPYVTRPCFYNEPDEGILLEKMQYVSSIQIHLWKSMRRWGKLSTYSGNWYLLPDVWWYLKTFPQDKSGYFNNIIGCNLFSKVSLFS